MFRCLKHNMHNIKGQGVRSLIEFNICFFQNMITWHNECFELKEFQQQVWSGRTLWPFPGVFSPCSWRNRTSSCLMVKEYQEESESRGFAECLCFLHVNTYFQVSPLSIKPRSEIVGFSCLPLIPYESLISNRCWCM